MSPRSDQIALPIYPAEISAFLSPPSPQSLNLGIEIHVKAQTKRRLRESCGKNRKRSNRQTLVGSEARSTNIHGISTGRVFTGEMVGLAKYKREHERRSIHG